MSKPLLDVVGELNLKFRSGNTVPVERATFSKKEWNELLQAVWEAQCSINQIVTSLCTEGKLSAEGARLNQLLSVSLALTSQGYLCPHCGHLENVDAFIVDDTYIVCPSCEKLCIET